MWLAIAGITAIGAALLYLRFRRKHPDEAKIAHLRKVIEKSFEAAEPNLCPLVI